MFDNTNSWQYYLLVQIFEGMSAQRYFYFPLKILNLNSNRLYKNSSKNEDEFLNNHKHQLLTSVSFSKAYGFKILDFTMYR